MCSADSIGYVELHAHSAYSFLDGASMPHELTVRAAALGYDRLALTDHDSLAGALEFAHAAKAEGVVPITGAEVTVEHDFGGDAHVTLIVRTAAGYRNLCRLLTAAYRPRIPKAILARVRAGSDVVPPPGRPPSEASYVLGSPERPHPRVTIDELCAHAEGLTLLTGCARRGLLVRALTTSSNSERNLQLMQRLQQAFGKQHAYVELQLLRHPGDTQRNRHLMQLADRAGAPLVATGNVHAHSVERARLADALVAVRHNTSLEACEVERAGNLALLMRSPDDMARLFHHVPDAVRNTRVIAESVEFDITCDLGYRYPEVHDASGLASIAVLAQTCSTELERRYAGLASITEARARLEEELRLIDKHGLGGFFLLHHEILELARTVAHEIRGAGSARSLNPPGRGRGSSVESIVCYLTGLSHVDPLQNKLHLGRFLNDDLISVPDIDLDFPRDIRHELLRRIITTYGDEHCAMVAAHGTFRMKSAVRDIGKALGLPSGELQRLAHRVDSYSAKRIAEFVDGEGPRWQALAQLTGEVANLPRGTGLHCGGMIISTDPLCDIVPLQPAAMPGRQMCQWDKDSCSDAGFLKIDVLGLGMLSSVEECIESIALNTGRHVDLSRIDYDEKAVYEQIQSGDTVGTFQIESRAQIASIQRVRPANLQDLMVQVAIVRPGPIVGKSVNPYIQMRERLREDPNAQVPYEHPSLAAVLGDTLGAVIYQDQVIEVAMHFAGFTAGEADGLRRAMTRKRSAESMEAYHERFIRGALARWDDCDAATAEKVFEKIVGFAQYGFPRAHSAAFAILSYQSAWLRHHYAAHWYAALINAQPVGFYPSHSLVRDGLRHGVTTRAVDVNVSRALCTVEGDNDLRLGISSLAGINYMEALAVQRERDEHGPFVSLEDFVRRVALRRDQLETAISAGACECFGQARREQLWQVGLIVRERDGQQPLEMAAPGAPKLSQLSLWEEMSSEFAATGISTKVHPVELLRGVLSPKVIATTDITPAKHGHMIEVVGVVIATQRPGTAKGIIFVLLEDEHGTINIVLQPELAKKVRPRLLAERIIHVTGRVRSQKGIVSVVGHDVHILPPQVRRKLPAIPAGKQFC